ncbi:MAG TPA: TIM barrel protein [Candidatus Limnocylindrales bacterium]
MDRTIDPWMAGRPLDRATLGINQILWANDDLPELTPPIDALAILDEMARLGYAGSQLGTTFPRGAALREALGARGLRIAEVYACLECTPDGPVPAAAAAGRAKLAELHDAGGDVLVAALPLSPLRVGLAGRAFGPAVPRLTPTGMERLARLLETLGREAADLGHRLVFHHHAGTFVETPDELGRLMDAADPEAVGLNLDTGHYLLGGGDPVAALRRYGERVRHVHLKDVDPAVAARLRVGELAGFLDGLRQRVFCEVGQGELDVRAVLEALARRDYDGWIVVEHDTTWRTPSESAAMSYAVIHFALRDLARHGLPD